MSWWASSAEEFRKQITIAVSPSHQKLAEQTEDGLQSLSSSLFGTVTTLAEQSEASLRKGADSVATSAQLFASQTDEGFQTLRGSILESATNLTDLLEEAMPLTMRRHAEREVTAEELAQRFESEAALLSGALSGAADSFGVVGTLGSTFKLWEERLDADTQDASRSLVMPALRALVRTSAFKGVLEALVASGAAPRQRVLRSAAEFAAAEDKEAASCGEGGASPEEVAGEQLAKVLAASSVAPQEVQRDLLSLLFSATEAADRCRCGSLSKEAVAAEEDVRWLTKILAATLPDSREADTLAASRLCESVERVLASANACQAKNLLVSGTPVPKPPPSPKLCIGAEVWACWPGNGCWYRAQIQGFIPKRERTHIKWLRPPLGGQFYCSDEFLVGTGSDESLFGELSSSSVLLVEETIRRPPPTPDDSRLPVEQWEGRLAAVESHCQHFNQLRVLGKQLDSHRQWTQTPSSDALGHSDDEPEPLPLEGAASTLQALREEAEERAEALGYVASECADEQVVFQEQIKTSTGAMASELSQLEQERVEVVAKTENLRFRREELLEQLRMVNEELTVAEKTKASLDLREQHLQESMTRVADELAEQVDHAKEHGALSAKRQSTIQRSVTASRAVEELLAKRSEAVAEATDVCDKLLGQQSLVDVTCLTSDRARCLELQELLASWHECIWGPEAGLIPQDPERANALRAGHLQALGSVQDAIQEVEQTIVDCGGTLEGLFGFNANSDVDKSVTLRQMNRALNTYKEMRQQLKENLERLAEVEAVVPGTTGVNPPVTLRLSSRRAPTSPGKPAASGYAVGPGKPGSPPVKAVDDENEDGI